MEEQDVNPKKQIYWLLLVIVFIGCAGSAIYVLRGFWDITDTMLRFPVPGTYTVNLAEPGRYYIYHEYHSVIAGEAFSAKPRPAKDFAITVQNPGKEQVKLYPNKYIYYSIGGMDGTSLLYFDAKTTGKYTFSANYAPGIKVERTVMALGGNTAEKSNRTFINGVDIFLNTLLVTIVFWFSIFFARLYSKRKLSSKMSSTMKRKTVYNQVFGKDKAKEPGKTKEAPTESRAERRRKQKGKK